MKVLVEHLDKSFGEKQVLRDFSLPLPERGAVALVGPSGCGKTTLLRLIAGLERPDGGQAACAAGIKLSVVFQEDRLLNPLTARGNILAVLPKGTDPAVADDHLARCGLQEAAGLRPGELSGGMRRRLAIARAIAYGGGVLLLDEPFKGLDAELKSRVMEYAFQGAAGRLTLMVTHDLEEVLRAADEIFFLDGPPLRIVYKAALEEFSAALRTLPPRELMRQKAALLERIKDFYKAGKETE